ncbi:hypothetical protein LTR17_007476 [Elasticomyces elasticus]|nr:hypothetical protein LTR17_007476 [Elasticomyces elasticus]
MPSITDHDRIERDYGELNLFRKRQRLGLSSDVRAAHNELHEVDHIEIPTMHTSCDYDTQTCDSESITLQPAYLWDDADSGFGEEDFKGEEEATEDPEGIEIVGKRYGVTEHASHEIVCTNGYRSHPSTVLQYPNSHESNGDRHVQRNHVAIQHSPSSDPTKDTAAQQRHNSESDSGNTGERDSGHGAEDDSEHNNDSGNESDSYSNSEGEQVCELPSVAEMYSSKSADGYGPGELYGYSFHCCDHDESWEGEEESEEDGEYEQEQRI